MMTRQTLAVLAVSIALGACSRDHSPASALNQIEANDRIASAIYRTNDEGVGLYLRRGFSVVYRCEGGGKLQAYVVDVEQHQSIPVGSPYDVGECVVTQTPGRLTLRSERGTTVLSTTALPLAR